MADTTVQRRRSKAPERRRQDILRAALRLFHDRGFDATTVQHIADAAGVAAGTVYLYFPSKEHVLLSMHDEFHAAMREHLAGVTEVELARAADSPEGAGEGIDAMVDGVVEFLLDRLEETTVMCRYLPRVHDEVHDHDGMAQLVAAAIRLGMEAGRVHVSDPDMAGQLFTAALRDPLVHAVVDGDEQEVQRLAAQAKELFRKALALSPET